MEFNKMLLLTNEKLYCLLFESTDKTTSKGLKAR